MNGLIDRLDKIANELENQGLMEEAEALDVVANTLEKEAYRTESLPVWDKLSKALEQAEENKSIVTEDQLRQAKYALENMAVGRPLITELKEANQHCKLAQDALERERGGDNLNSTAMEIRKAMKFLKAAEPYILKAQMGRGY